MKKGKLKTIHVVIWGGSILSGLFFSAMFALGAIDSEMLGTKPLLDINGVWVEKEVAPYVADSFELRPAGVFVGGRLVSTRYEWNGSTLKYRLGDDIYIYKYHAERLVRQQPAHYISSFARENLPDNCLVQHCS